MRDLVVTLLVFGSLPLILRKPFFGVLVWTWLGLMNPHQLCWGFATGLPFSQMVALTLFASLLISREPKSLPWSALTALLALWWVWMLVTTFFALNPDGAWVQWDKVWKVMLLIFVTIAMLDSRRRVDALVWTMVLSLGFYGVKGGIFTITTGGAYHVYGPAGTFMAENNATGMALVMTVPLMRYLQLASTHRIVKTAMTAAIGLTFVAILGTQSRGALLGMAAMALYLALKSSKRAPLLVAMAVFLPLAVLFMPDAWFGRMETIGTYEQDASAMGRINAWWTSWYLALDRPITGGGFETMTRAVYAQYSPQSGTAFDVHSIYFEALGEHGFVGLALFLSIELGALISLSRVIAFARRRAELTWMRDLASMTYVSIIGYAVSGAFLGLAYFDYYYVLIAVAIALSRLKAQYQKQGVPAQATADAAAAGPKSIPAGQRNPRVGPGARTGILRTVAEWYRTL